MPSRLPALNFLEINCTLWFNLASSLKLIWVFGCCLPSIHFWNIGLWLIQFERSVGCVGANHVIMQRLRQSTQQLRWSKGVPCTVDWRVIACRMRSCSIKCCIYWGCTAELAVDSYFYTAAGLLLHSVPRPPCLSAAVRGEEHHVAVISCFLFHQHLPPWLFSSPARPASSAFT